MWSLTYLDGYNVKKKTQTEAKHRNNTTINLSGMQQSVLAAKGLRGSGDFRQGGKNEKMELICYDYCNCSCKIQNSNMINVTMKIVNLILPSVSYCQYHHHQSNVLTGQWAYFLDHVGVESRFSGLYRTLKILAGAAQQ